MTDPFKASQIGKRVKHVAGVRDLDNRTVSLPVSIFDDQLRATLTARIYRDPMFWQYGLQPNPPIHIIVDHGHVTLTGVVNSEVEWRVAKATARSADFVFSVAKALQAPQSVAVRFQPSRFLRYRTNAFVAKKGWRSGMESFDAVIVGGGPAGSTCARQLRRAGLRVCVLDRAVFPRDKVCAGWITPPVVELLQLDIDEYRHTRVFQPITAFRTALIGRAETETCYAQPVSFGIRRCEFDHYLLQRSGARVRCGEPLSDLRRSGGQWIINNAVSTPLLVGAGGHFCPVARRLNRDRPNGPVVATLEMEVPLSDRQLARVSLRPERPQLYFCEDLKGYGWCFRKGHFLNVGLGRQDARQLPRRTQAFLGFLIAQDVVPDDVPMRLHGHAYLLADTSPRLPIGDGVLLTGDAAGLADPHSGEGIRPAVESGVLAASAIVSANGQYDRDSLGPYQQSLQARFGASNDGRPATPSLPPWLVQRLANGLLNWGWFTRRIVLDRWFLGRQRPSLAMTV